LAAGAIVPVIGGLGVLVGMSMRVTNPGIESRLALPLFISEHLPALPAGIALATLLVVLVGSAAGLSLGIATVVVRDLLPARWLAHTGFADAAALDAPSAPQLDAAEATPDVPTQDKRADAKQLLVTRAILLAVLLGAAAICLFDMGGLILSWSFLSMGLRGAVAFWPAMAALFLRGRINRRFVVPAMIAAPIATALGAWLGPDGIDPVWFGIAASLVVMVAGGIAKKPPEGGFHTSSPAPSAS
jgi:SSS family solute:Na+ symporter